MDIIYIIMFVGVIYAFVKAYKWLYHHEHHKDDLYFQNVCESVRYIYDIVNQLEQIEDIITDIEACNNHSLKGVRVSVPSLLGRDNIMSMLIDGTDFNSRQLLQIAYSERQKKRSSLLTAIKEMSVNGVTKAVTKAIPEDEDEERGEG